MGGWAGEGHGRALPGQPGPLRPHTCAHTLTATGKTGRGGLHAGLGTRFRNQLSPTRSFKQKPGTHSPGELNKAGNSLASFLSLATRANQGTRTVSTWNWNQTPHLSKSTQFHVGFRFWLPREKAPRVTSRPQPGRLTYPLQASQVDVPPSPAGRLASTCQAYAASSQAPNFFAGTHSPLWLPIWVLSGADPVAGTESDIQ